MERKIDTQHPTNQQQQLQDFFDSIPTANVDMNSVDTVALENNNTNSNMEGEDFGSSLGEALNSDILGDMSLRSDSDNFLTWLWRDDLHLGYFLAAVSKVAIIQMYGKL